MDAVGADVLAISRMEQALSRSGARFLDRVFTRAEQDAGAAHPRRAAYFAAGFAAKEAVFKLFGDAWPPDGAFTDIEISRGANGEPQVRLAGPMLERAGPGAQVQVSLSWDGDVAFAVALLVSGKPVSGTPGATARNAS